MRQLPKSRQVATPLASAGKSPVSPSMSADVKLQAALDRISVLERQLSMLLGVIEIGTNGDVRIACGGTLTLDGARGTHARSDVEIVLSGPGCSAVLGLAEVALESSTRLRLQSSAMQCVSGMVRVDSSMVQASGTVRCDTIIANSVVGTSYTPGAGNIW